MSVCLNGMSGTKVSFASALRREDPSANVHANIARLRSHPGVIVDMSSRTAHSGGNLQAVAYSE